jgi:hypothetical protein
VCVVHAAPRHQPNNRLPGQAGSKTAALFGVGFGFGFHGVSILPSGLLHRQ